MPSYNNAPASNRGSWLSCRRILALIAGMIAIPMLMLGTGLLSLRLTLFNPFYLQEFPARQGVYDQLSGLLVDVLLEETAPFLDLLGTVVDVDQLVNPQDLEELVTALLPAGWAQEQVQKNISETFNWLEGDAPTPLWRLEWRTLQASVNIQDAQQLVRGYFERLPPCELDLNLDLSNLDLFSENFFEQDLFQQDIFKQEPAACRPPDILLEPVIQGALPALQNIYPPDTVFTFTPAMAAQLENVRWAYQVFARGTWPVLLAGLFLLGLTVLLGARLPEEVFFWAGVPSLVAGALSALLVFALQALLPNQVAQFFTGAPLESSIPSALLFFASDLAQSLAQDALDRSLSITGALLLIGIVSIAVGFVIRRLQK